MGIASEVILGLVNVGATLLGSYMQNETLSESQAEARSLNNRQIGLQIAQMRSQEKLSKEQLRLNKEQLKESTRLNEEQLKLKKAELGMTQNEYAHNAFREQASKLTSLFEGNEQLKSLYINRLKGLRG